MRLQVLTLALLLGLSAPVLGEATHTANGTVNLDDRRDIARRLPILPMEQAQKIALQRVPGKFLGAAIETNDGIRTWQVDIVDLQGRKVRMWLNANTGAYLKQVDLT